ncbi:kinase-like domain-containing protein [Aspergillus egyptiacus]|nr:kinase-like domain-containing protein [Aspergillus egyptiacus]
MSHASQSISPTSGFAVGTISLWDEKTGKTSQTKTVYSREEIYVGRDQRRCQYVVDDPFVSNKHLWIYTVIFDQDNPGEIAPLVYAQDISMNGTLWNGYRMGNGRSSFLLSDGDILQLAQGVHLKYNSEDHSQAKCFSVLQTLEMRAFANEYIVTRRKLGSGAYGQVHMAYKRSTGQQFACKIVDLRAARDRLAKEGEAQHEQTFKKAIDPKLKKDFVELQLQGKLDQYHREAKILETLQHPNIIGLEKVIKSDNTIYMFQDLLTAGDLFSYIQYKGGRLPDIEAAVIVRQIVIALKYLHDRNIVHRDLKPDNILMTSRADGCRVVLTDFGCATLLDANSARMSSMVGTLEFSAPEVIKKTEKGYTKAADLWSLGVLTAILLTGEPPFDGLPKGRSTIDQRQAAMRKLMARMDRYRVGERAQNFVYCLLQYEVARRMDVNEALYHTWFTNPCHRADFEALYRRSIRDWRPRSTKKPQIVRLELYFGNGPSGSTEHDTSVKSESSAQETPSSTSLTDDTGDEESEGLPRTPSDTLSDPILPPLGNFDVNLERTPQCTSSSKSNSLVDLSIMAEQPRTDLYGNKRAYSGVHDEEGDVYEEVSNPVTGKRQQVIYGACTGLE